MSISTTAPRVFRPTAGSTAVGAALIVVGTAALAFGAGCAVLLLAHGGLRRSVQDVIVTVVIIAVAVAGLAHLAARVTTRVVVEPGEVRVERLGRVIRRWDRATSQFGSRAIRTGDGATTATARHLVVTSATRTDDYPLWRFSEEQFTALVALLAPVRLPAPAGAPPAPVADARAQSAPSAPPVPTSGSFALDRRPLDRVVRRSLIAGLGSLAVIFVISIVVLDLIAADDPTFPGLIALVIAVAFFLLLGAVVVARQRATLRPIPRSVDVSPSSIRIGERGGARDVPLGSLERIDITPSSYTVGQRTLVLVPSDGSRPIRVQLGGAGVTPQQRDQIFPEYGRFVDTVLAASAWRGPGFVRFLLG